MHIDEYRPLMHKLTCTQVAYTHMYKGVKSQTLVHIGRDENVLSTVNTHRYLLSESQHMTAKCPAGSDLRLFPLCS